MDTSSPSEGSTTVRRPTGVGVALIMLGIVGWIAAFTLSLEKLRSLADPTASLSCDFSVLVQCQRNLTSWQGELFGFPNPFLGVAGWVVPITVGVALLAGARFARWFWLLFAMGMAGALALIIFLIYQSIYVLATLCPWCMVTWAVTIPAFWIAVLHCLREVLPPRHARLVAVAQGGLGFVPVVSLVSYALIAVLAQLQLDVISYL